MCVSSPFNFPLRSSPPCSLIVASQSVRIVAGSDQGSESVVSPRSGKPKYVPIDHNVMKIPVAKEDPKKILGE